MTFFTRKPRARTSPQRDLSAAPVSVTKSHREVIDHGANDPIPFELSEGWLAVARHAMAARREQLDRINERDALRVRESVRQ